MGKPNRPVWDEEKHLLTLNGRVVKRFKGPAPN